MNLTISKIVQIILNQNFFGRYVDDTFILFPDASHVPFFLEYLNSKNPNIRFTHDLEKDGKLNFLDVTINRIDDQFSTSVYRKPNLLSQD